LHPQEIAAIARHAEDRFLIVDDVLLPVLEKFRADVSFEKIIVVPYGCGDVPSGFLNYEELLANASPGTPLPKIDENDGAAMCFTSGTTGSSKGVIYSHRALVLHSFAEAMVDSMGLSHCDTVLPVAPMFHANAWGLPYTCAMVGARLVLPGPNVDAESVLDLMEQERVTFAGGVPTVWMGVLQALEANPARWKFSKPIRLACGGSAPPEQLIRGLDKFGIRLIHLWGMTETTPLATLGLLKQHMWDWPEDKQYGTVHRAARNAARGFCSGRTDAGRLRMCMGWRDGWRAGNSRAVDCCGILQRAGSGAPVDGGWMVSNG